MDLNRRHLIGASVTGVAGTLALAPEAARATRLPSVLGRDATQYGVRPGSADDQTRALQRAIDEATRAQVPLVLPPGVYRTGMLRLQNGAQLVGVRGATKLTFNAGDASMILCEGASHADITGHPSANPNAANEYDRVAQAMRADWAAFATNGNPGWAPYEPNTRTTRVYDTDTTDQPYPEEASRRLWANHRFTALDPITHDTPQGRR